MNGKERKGASAQQLELLLCDQKGHRFKLKNIANARYNCLCSQYVRPFMDPSMIGSL